MSMNVHLISPNGNLDLPISIDNTSLAVARQPVSFSLPTGNQATDRDIGIATRKWKLNGTFQSAVVEGVVVGGRILRALAIDLIQNNGWSQSGGRAKILPGSPNPSATLTGTNEHTLQLGWRPDPNVWTSSYATFPYINSNLSSGATSFTVQNPGRIPSAYGGGSPGNGAFFQIGEEVVWVGNYNNSTGAATNVVRGALGTNPQAHTVNRQTSDASITTGTSILQSNNAVWTDADIGTTVTVSGAGAAGGALTATVIAFYPGQVSGTATQVLLNTNASTTVSNATLTIYSAPYPFAVTNIVPVLPLQTWEVYGTPTAIAINWQSADAADVFGVETYTIQLDFDEAIIYGA